MIVPSQTVCLKLIRDMEMMPHILDHSLKVRDVALFLCHKLLTSNPELDCDLIGAAAMLHDITKTRSFITGEKHSDTGNLLLRELGYNEIGDIVRQHVVLDHYSEKGSVSAAEIVNYADKRVLHDQVVLLDARLEYILKRYGTTLENESRIRLLWKNTRILEKKIFFRLSMDPDALEFLLGTEVDVVSRQPCP